VRHAEDISLRIRAYAEGQRRDPQELLDDLDEHVGDEGKFVNRSDAIRASIRKTLDMLMRSMNDTDGLRQTKLSLTSRTHWNRRCTTDCVSAVS